MLEFFLFATLSRTVMGPIQPPIQWVLGTLSLGVLRPGRETDRSPPSSQRISGAIHSLPQYAFVSWCLVKEKSRGTTLPYLLFMYANKSVYRRTYMELRRRKYISMKFFNKKKSVHRQQLLSLICTSFCLFLCCDLTQYF